MSSTNPSAPGSGLSSNASNLSIDGGRTSIGSETVYPPQRHAGKVGYGPEYHKGASFGDKIKGYEEELKGHITHNPQLVQHGKDMASGELKRREREHDLNDEDPFANPSKKQDETAHKTPPGAHGAKEQTATVASAGTAAGERQ